MEIAISLFKQYSGQGMIVTLFLVAVLYLWFVEKNRENRRLLVWFPIALLVLFFCPLVVYFMEKLAEEDIYWRLLWSIPMLLIIAYAMVVFVRKLEGIKRYLGIVMCLAFIVISGNFLYNNPNFLKAENPEHMPSEVVDICEEIIVEGREVKACFPSEFLMYVTQYTSLVHMPYGREMFLRSDGAIAYNTLYDTMECLLQDTIDVDKLATELRNTGCHYVILKEDAPLVGKMQDVDFVEYAKVDEYVIYLDKLNDPH